MSGVQQNECSLCKGKKFEYILKQKNVNFLDDIKEFEIHRCVECSLCQLYPLPDLNKIKKIYEDERSFTKTIENPNKGKLFFNILLF